MRDNSHSHTEISNYNSIIRRNEDVTEILLRVLLTIGGDALNHIPYISTWRLRLRVSYAKKFNRDEEVIKYYKEQVLIFRNLIKLFLKFLIKDTFLVTEVYIKKQIKKLR